MDAPTKNTGLIDTTAAIAQLVDSIHGLPTTPPSLYLDLEGENLSRDGTLDILQLHILPSNQTHLLDVHVLGHQTFTTPGTCGLTLKAVLESQDIPKVFFDVRCDSDALYSHFQIRLAGVQDLQLMELAKRPQGRRRFISGLARCIEYDSGLAPSEKRTWKSNKEKGRRLFAPELGGSFRVFGERPLREEIQQYCVQDAIYLPRLWSAYEKQLTPTWKARIAEATKARVAESQAPIFAYQGPHMRNGPVGWDWL